MTIARPNPRVILASPVMLPGTAAFGGEDSGGGGVEDDSGACAGEAEAEPETDGGELLGGEALPMAPTTTSISRCIPWLQWVGTPQMKYRLPVVVSLTAVLPVALRNIEEPPLHALKPVLSTSITSWAAGGYVKAATDGPLIMFPHSQIAAS